MTYSLPFEKTNQFNSLVNSYLLKEKQTKSLYNSFPTKNNIIKHSAKKLANYKNREVLVSVLSKQNQQLTLSKKQTKNLTLLSNKNTVTITTGHQLNLLTGPIYFIYKILQTIKLCDELNTAQDKIKYVPIFWLASEDHDWQEVNHFYYKNQKFESKSEAKGCVGEISCDEVKSVFSHFLSQLQEAKYKQQLVDLVNQSYLKENISLTEATRKLVHELFKEYGLLILDGNDKELKQLAIPFFKDEINNQSVQKNITKTNLLIPKNQQQATAREINLFYKDKNLRERIVKKDDLFLVNNQPELVFTKEEINKLIENEPEKFSPNVLMRPVYQEIVLPNVAYVGGGGEIAYWLQLKSYFDSQKIPFPILVPRNSILLLTEKQQKKLEKLKISYSDLFLPINELINKKIKEKSTLKIDFEKIEREVKRIYYFLNKKAQETEKTFGNLVLAQRQKQLNGLAALEKRVLKAEKIKHQETADRIIKIKEELFPNNNLQERTVNFSEFYMELGGDFLDTIYKSIVPIHSNFIIKTIN